MKNKKWYCSGLLLIFLFFYGCASSPDTQHIERNIHSAEMMVSEAREAGADTYAPLAVRVAEEKIEAAKTALKQGEAKTASRLAEEAMLEAKTAERKAEAEKAKKRLKAEEKDVEILKDEVKRAQ